MGGTNPIASAVQASGFGQPTPQSSPTSTPSGVMPLSSQPTPLGGQNSTPPTMPQMPGVPSFGAPQQYGHGQVLQQFLQNHPNLPPQAVAELQQMIARLQGGPGAPQMPFQQLQVPQMPPLSAPQAPTGIMPLSPFAMRPGQ